MAMSKKLTFSLASLVVILALVAMPAMAVKLKAEWKSGNWEATLTLTEDEAKATGIGELDGTLGFINVADADGFINVANVTATIIDTDHSLEKGTTAADKSVPWTFSVPAAADVTVAVQLTGYQRVVFPVARANAKLAETSLARLAKLKTDPTVGTFYANYDSVDVVLEFEDMSTTTGAPNDLHKSDVIVVRDDVTSFVSPDISSDISSDWIVRGVSGKTVKVGPVGVPSNTAVKVLLSSRIATTTATNDYVEGPTIVYDATDPTIAAAPVPSASAVGDDRVPADGKWVNAFDIEFTITDGTSVTAEDDLNSKGKLKTIDVSDFSANPDKLAFSKVGLAQTSTGGSYTYVVRVTPKGTIADGERVEIRVTVTDAAGNENTDLLIHTATLAERTAGAAAVYDSAAPADGNVSPSGVIVVTFDSDPGTVTADMDATVAAGDSAATRKVTIPATAAAGELVITLTWGDNTEALTYTVVEVGTRRDLTGEAEFTLSGMLASNSFIIVAPVDNPDIDGEMIIADLPNIQRFFARGGTISLVGGSGDAGDDPNKSVVISEMMWGLNLGAEEVAEQPDYQWIELLNTDNALSDTDDTNDAAAAIDLSTYKLVFTPGTVVPKPAAMSDQVSNVEFLGWDVNIGQSGKIYTGDEDPVPDTFVAVDLVSMYRGINYTNLRKKHGDKNAADNRVEQLKAIPGGNADSGWEESTVNDTYAINQLGSPGAQHFEGRSTTTDTSATYAVVINEVGNNSGDSYDWIELLNTGTTLVNLQNWEITEITGVDTETALVTFQNNDKHQIPADGILLIVNSDPYRDPDHPVAAGTIINSDKLREEKTGINSRYYVSSGLKLRDDGKMALLVRNANDKEKSPDNVIDFTGPRPFNNIVDLSSKYRTNQWPLRAQGPGGANVFQGDLAEAFASGSTYWRNKKKAGNADDTWRKAGYSGVGYKRGASGDGTPGYANGIVQATETALATASAGATVTISEIMYDRGDRDNLPQWIELYNSSDTHAVNLNEWKLKIENADDVDVRRTVTIANLGGTIIPPNQTVLIVAYTTGRVSRGSQGRDDFPSKRVINLSGKAELEIAEDATKRNYRLLSETAFQLTLIEKGGTVGVDTAGNLGADGTAMWALPMAEDGAGRSSIIRRYDKDVDTNGDPIGLAIDRDGTMIPPADGTGAWVLASVSDLSEVQVNETYYGSPDDVGTPGYRGGGALPVSLSKFRPERLDSGEIVVRWITESELNNAGFNILRSDARDGEFTKLNTKLIAGQGTTSERTVYEFPDTTAKPNVVYYYQIQDVSLDGKVQTLRQSRIKGYVSPSGKLTTTWGDLKLQD